MTVWNASKKWLKWSSELLLKVLKIQEKALKASSRHMPLFLLKLYYSPSYVSINVDFILKGEKLTNLI